MMADTKDTRAQLAVLQGGAQRAEQNDIKVLGESIWWSVKNVMLSKADLKAKLLAHGFSEGYMPKKKRVRSCVLQTLKDMEAEGFFRRIVEHPEYAVFVRVDESIDQAAETANYDAAVKFRYDKKKETLTSSDPALQDDIDAYMALYADSFLTNEIRTVIGNIAYSKELNAFPLRAEGGFYFVPHENLDALDRLEKLINSLADGCYLGRLAIPETDQAKGVVAKSYVDDFRAEIASAKAEIQKLKDVGTYRDSTLQKKLEALLEVQQNSQIYLQMLNIDKKEIEQSIKALEGDIMSLFRGDNK